MDKVKYAVTIHCVYEGPVEETFEKCMIRPATFEDEEYDGMNYVIGACRETFDFYIIDDLEEAILSTHFNPNVIEFVNLDGDDVVRKDKIISKYGWDPMNGVYRKVFLRENNDLIAQLKNAKKLLEFKDETIKCLEEANVKYREILADVFNKWSETDKETGGFNLHYIYDLAHFYKIEI